MKIFGIGFQKTGTASLARALGILGFRTRHGVVLNGPKAIPVQPPLTHQKILPIAMETAREYDAVCDNPFPLFYRELDREFPGSKFILTIRDPQEWIASMVRHFGERRSDTLQWIYGVPTVKGNETRCLAVCNLHNTTVRAHFKSRPAQLLEINVTKGEGWERLCPYLGRAVPNFPFPHDNTSEERERKHAGAWQRLISAVRSAFVV